MPDQSNLRQRKKASNKKKKQTTENENKVASVPPPSTTTDGDIEKETLLQTFLRHPLVRVTPYVLIPYLIYHAIFFVELRRPDIITKASLGLVTLRPALDAQDPRQVLILGAEAAENRYVMTGLAQPLKLEIVHEAFDADNYFCRDGSVSWFQILRFLEPLDSPGADREAKRAQIDSWKELCVDRNHSFVELFHPKEYGPTECNAYQKWSPCLSRKCLATVDSLWGCAWNANKECPQKFSKVLHQVRHPIRTIEMLKATVCPTPKLKGSFLRLVSGWFPHRDWSRLSCSEAMGWYVVDFHTTLIKARDAGLVDGIFQIERASPCEVASQAGFLDAFSTTAYQPNVKRTTKVCHDEKFNDAQSPDTFAKVKEKNGVKIPGLVTVTLEEFGDAALVKALTNLISNLGYDGDQDSEFV
jgi:hypothetical protein